MKKGQKESIIIIFVGIFLMLIGLIFWSNEQITFWGLDLFLGLIFVVYGLYLYFK